MSLAKGQDVSLLLLRTDPQTGTQRLDDEITDFTNVEVDWGLEVQTNDYVTASRPKSHGINNPATVTLAWDAISRAGAALAFAQRNANAPNATRIALRIDVLMDLDYGPEGAGRYRFPACVLSGSRGTVAGRTENFNEQATLTCDNPILVA